MKYIRFGLTAGKIETRHSLDSDALDPALLLTATETLNKLRASAAGVVCHVPGVALYWIGLGLPPIQYRSARTKSLISVSDTSDRSTEFFLMRDNHYVLFRVVPLETAENDPHLFGTIAGSSAAAEVRPPQELRDKRIQAELIAEIKAVASEIWIARPALVCDLIQTYPFSAFTDCFAAAMLLNLETFRD